MSTPRQPLRAYTTSSKKAVKAIKRKVSAHTYRSTLHKEPTEVITTLNRIRTHDPLTPSGLL